MTIPPVVRREPLGWIAIAHGVQTRAVLAIAAGWVLAALVARVGIPAVDPRLEEVPRPLETLGTVALCLPASLHASALRDQASWLVAVSARSARWLRFAWVCGVVGVGCVAALAWVATLPSDVPRLHAFTVWVLAVSCAVGSVVAFRHDLAVVLPLLLMATFSTSALVPFPDNVVYNVALTRELMMCAGVAVAAATVAFAVWGDRRARKDG